MARPNEKVTEMLRPPSSGKGHKARVVGDLRKTGETYLEGYTTAYVEEI